MKNFNVSRKDALAIALLDDWYDDVKDFGKNAIKNVRDYVSDNKHTIYPMVTNMATRIHPALGALVGTGLKTFGGAILS